MKKIIVLDQGRGRLANQLWNSASIYAYCLEKGYIFLNAAFTDYEHLFNFPKEGFWFRLLFIKDFRKKKLFIKARFYLYYLHLFRFLHKGSMIWSEDAIPFYLPPTENHDQEQKRIIEKIEISSKKTFYFNNWLFRNPLGIKKYHSQIRNYFSPKKEIHDKAHASIERARSIAPHIVGVHIRQGDYKTREKDFYFSPENAKPILEKYLSVSGKSSEETVFILCSDEAIDTSIFGKLQTFQTSGTAMEDLITLSKTDTVIGSNSTFGAFAAYYGNIPFIVFENEKMDWTSIEKKEYNYNNRGTRVHP